MAKHKDLLRNELNFTQKLKTWFGNKSVIVLTMGKVGTLSISNSLRKIGFNHVHPHSLIYSYPGTHFLKNIKLPIHKHLYFIYKTFTKRIKVFFWKIFTKKIVIITGVRDPFSRYISAFFEQSHYLNFDTNIESNENILIKLIQHGNFESTLEWFDKEINKTFGINIYEHKFNKSKGYQIISKKNIEIFIFRLDKLNNLENELGDFLANKKFKLHSHNILENNLNYRKIKKSYKFDSSDFENALSSNYMKHFFDKQDIIKLREKWMKS
jgi:hypothetical protein